MAKKNKETDENPQNVPSVNEPNELNSQFVDSISSINKILQDTSKIASLNHNIAKNGYSSFSGYFKDLDDITKKIGTQGAKLNEIFESKFADSKILIDSDIVDLKRRLNTAKKQYKEEQGNREEIQRLYDQLEEKQKSSHIINRIHPFAAEKFLKSEGFKSSFAHGNEVSSVVVSIDIRRSTDLMLKAKSPTEYSDFITGLSQKLSSVIINHLGIFDKFTGDGILAFFPNFYSGREAILLSILAANECHKVFQEHYHENRNKFTVHIKDIGLGIGIDYGNVSIANTSSELTVVGRPVVYACRFSGAKAGDTLLNLEAFEQIEKLNHPMIKDVEETEIFIKNEGNALAFKVKIDSSKYNFTNSFPWDDFPDDYSLDNEKYKNDKDGGI